MDGLVWLGVIFVVGGAALFAFGMRHDPMLAVGVTGGTALLTALLLFLIFSGRPSASPPIIANEPDEKTEEPGGTPPRPGGAQPFSIPAAVKQETPAWQNLSQVDLLTRIDPARDQLMGQWKMENGALITPMTQGLAPAKLTIPVKLPPSFQMTAVVERIQGRDSINLGFPVAGQDIMVCVDGYGGLYSGINLIDQATADRNESRRRGPFLQDGKPNTIICTVKGNSVHLTVDGKTAIDWQGDVSRLSLDTRWPHGPPGQVELGSWQTSYRITKLELQPLP